MSENTLEVELVSYEIMAIIEPDITEAQYKKHVATLKDMLKKRGAEVTNEQEWGKRDFAYTIKKKNNGFYVVINFNGDPAKALQLESDLRITPFIIRHLIIKTPAGYISPEYDWDAQPEVLVKEKEEEIVSKKESKPVLVVAPEPEIEEVEEVAETIEEIKGEEEEGEEVADTEEIKENEEEKPAKKANEEDEKEIMSDKVSSERLSKLDEKLEELLSSDHDLNL